jgi:hypothetical protein
MRRASAIGATHATPESASTLSAWVAGTSLEQADIEDALYTTAERTGSVTDDGQRQCRVTLRTRLHAGLKQPSDVDPGDQQPPQRCGHATARRSGQPRGRF